MTSDIDENNKVQRVSHDQEPIEEEKKAHESESDFLKSNKNPLSESSEVLKEVEEQQEESKDD
jgi:hypothetical protein